MTIRTLPELIRRFQEVRLPPKQTSIWAHCLLSRYQGEDWKEMIGMRSSSSSSLSSSSSSSSSLSSSSSSSSKRIPSQPILLYEDASSHEEVTYALEMYHWPISTEVFPYRLASKSHYSLRILEGTLRILSEPRRTGFWRAHPYAIPREATYRSTVWVEGVEEGGTPRVPSPTTVLTFRQTR